MTHSIPEPNALVIRTPVGTLLHTGDWKLDPDPVIGPPTDEAALRRLGDDGVLGDGLRLDQCVGRRHRALRGRAAGSLADLIGESENRVVVTCFATNVARLETIAGCRAPMVARWHWSAARCAAWRRRRANPATSGTSPLSSARRWSDTCRATRSCCSAPAARASRAPRCAASLRTSIRTSRWRRATRSSSPRAPSRATSAPSSACRTC